MTEVKEVDQSEIIGQLVAKGMSEKKASEIKLLDLRKVKNAVVDFFVICTGNSDTQLDAIADSVEEEVKKITGNLPWKREGRKNKEWILLDYVNVVAHIFKKDRREFYALEKLWGDAIVQELKD